MIADERGGNGLFVLTGSEQFRLSDAINRSLAGRTALLRLLPFSLLERQRAGAGGAVDEILYSGFYPRIIDQGINPTQALADYLRPTPGLTVQTPILSDLGLSIPVTH